MKRSLMSYFEGLSIILFFAIMIGVVLALFNFVFIFLWYGRMGYRVNLMIKERRALNLESISKLMLSIANAVDSYAAKLERETGSIENRGENT